MSNALIIFVRNLQLGKVKTRIAQDLGNHAALEIYQKLVAHTFDIVHPLNIDKYVYYADEIGVNDLWSRSFFNKRIQENTDLGSRMYKAFVEVFSEAHQKVCIIGSDCLQLTTALLKQAFELLDEYEIVIGPAKDGGYYLLGMKEQVRPIFSPVDWSTYKVLEQSLQLIHEHGYSYVLLPRLQDVDTVNDVPEAWLQQLQQKGNIE